MRTRTISAGAMARHLQKIRFAMEWIERAKAAGSEEYRNTALQYAREYLGDLRDELLEVALTDVAVETMDAAPC